VLCCVVLCHSFKSISCRETDGNVLGGSPRGEILQFCSLRFALKLLRERVQGSTTIHFRIYHQGEPAQQRRGPNLVDFCLQLQRFLPSTI